MAICLGHALFTAAGIGLALIAVQIAMLTLHVRRPAPSPRATPPISILKPLCGVDEGIEESLALFASLDYPAYEVLLGVVSARDPAWEIACAACRRWPERFRVLVQNGSPGFNPKVNQLVTLARAARHDLLVVSDSNVRVDRGYLREIAALLEDDDVGLVTHPIAGTGGARLGSLMDSLHLVSSVSPAIVAARPLVGRDVVVGKSMALRRRDLRALGGFEAVKDVLAEDYVMGVMVSDVLRKRVAVGRRPVLNVSERRSLGEFAARYRRWGVMQRQAVGPLAYAGSALLNPVLLAAVAAAVERTPAALAGFALACAVKSAVDGVALRALQPARFAPWQLAVVPLKDIVQGACWACALARTDVNWRGTHLRVLPGTRIAAPPPATMAPARAPEGAARA
jgi:ceramide glucosyltransferase